MMAFWRCFIILVCFWGVSSGAEPPSCTTPNGERAQCVKLTKCPILVEAVDSDDTETQKFVDQSTCGSKKFMVCCGTHGNFTKGTDEPKAVIATEINTVEINETHRDIVLKSVLPSKRFCGYQHTDDYFYNGTATSVDEFPWLLYITVYKPPQEESEDPYELRCVGVLISQQYALTATECDAFSFNTVIVGKHNRFKDSDCVKTPFGVNDCSTPEVTLEVAEKIKSKNGILLVRLKKKVQYNTFIRPICIPLPESPRPQVGDKLLTSGWGDLSLEDSNVESKKRVEHTLKAPYENDLVFVNSTNYDDCFGDDGGPLMYRSRNWYVEAVIPPFFCFGKTAARRITPEISQWIIQNMRR